MHKYHKKQVFKRDSEAEGDMFTFLINSQFIHILIVVLLYSQPEKLKSNSQKNKIHNHIKNTHILTKIIRDITSDESQ